MNVSKHDSVIIHSEVLCGNQVFPMSWHHFCLEFSPSPHPSPSSSPTLPDGDVAVFIHRGLAAGLETTKHAERYLKESGKDVSFQFRPSSFKGMMISFLLCFLLEIYTDGDFFQPFILFT